MTTPPEDETLRELGAVADELLEQAAALRRRWEELGDVLGVELEAAEAGQAADATDGAGAATPAPRAAAEPDPLDGPVARSEYDVEEDPDPVRVLVFDLMLSGRSRKEVKECVRASFGSEADLSIVDELFDAR